MAAILVVAAHPDDEVLGCGGVMARHAARGDRVHILILGEGAMSRHATPTPKGRREVERLRHAAQRAARLLGAKELVHDSLPDNRFDTVPLLDLVKAVERMKARVRPETVYTHHGGDLNVDHRCVHEAVLAACRPLPGDPVKQLLAFETLSSTEWAQTVGTGVFQPDRFVDISRTLGKKLAACRAYRSEFRRFPHPRSLEGVAALARQRGMSVGLRSAEAFMTIRHIEE